MTKKLLVLIVVLALLQGYTRVVGQSSDDLLNLMIGKGLISQTEADSIRAEAAIKAQTAKEKQKNFTFNTSRLLQFSGYTQIRFQGFEDGSLYDGLDIRRARLDLRGDITSTWEYRLQVEFATVARVLDAYAVFKPYPFLKVEAGQFKVPLSAESLTASNKLDFIDRSQVVEAMVSRGKDVLGNNNGRDLGVMVFGNLFRHNDRFLADYYVGGFNGQGISIADKNDAKDFAARLVLHPLKGLDIGGAYYNGYQYVIIKPDTGNFIRTRYAGEIGWTWKWIGLKGEYMTGNDGPLKREGFYAQAVFTLLSKKLQLLARCDQFDPDKNKGQDISIWYVSGFNFFFNDYVKTSLNYSYRTEEGGEERQVKNNLLSVQLQIGF